jgi:hypothetical protein
MKKTVSKKRQKNIKNGFFEKNRFFQKFSKKRFFYKPA